MNNSVQFILKQNLNKLSLEDKCMIKYLGRPTPYLDINQKSKSNGKVFYRTFHPNLYQRNSWICGCDSLDRLFCFPCLLCSLDKKDAWSKNGINDLGHLSQKIKIHETSLAHINACLDLSMLGKTRIRELLSDEYRRSIEWQNQEINKNRYILNKMIDCIKFCGEFELGLRGHDGSTESKNSHPVFNGLVNFTTALDNILKNNLSTATIFESGSKDIRNDLLDCMLAVCQESIISEIDKSDFVSIISDQATEVVSSDLQRVIILRYVLKYGNPVERFWSFFSSPEDDATALSDCIKNVLNRSIGKRVDKLISQSYDGSIVMGHPKTGVEALIKSQYPHAFFVHCYAHQLNLIIAQAVSYNNEVRIFFANLSEICNFFRTNSNNVSNEIVKKLTQSVPTVNWDFHSCGVITIFENKEKLLECLEIIECTAKQQVTICQALGIRLKMQQAYFSFWLELFYKIMPHVNYLHNQFYTSRFVTEQHIKNSMYHFSVQMSKIMDDIDNMNDNKSEEQVPKKNSSYGYIADHESRKVVAKEVCTIIIDQMSKRFQFTGHLVAATLFETSNFKTFGGVFPHDTVTDVVYYYPFLNQEKLKPELRLIYTRKDFHSVEKPTDLLRFFIENNLDECFHEVTKLLKLLATIPMISSETENCTSGIKRMKNFLGSTVEEERLSSVAMLFMEKDLIHNMLDFNERVIDKFVSMEERQKDFRYKHPSDIDTSKLPAFLTKASKAGNNKILGWP